MKEKKSKRVIVRITESQFNNLMECVIDEQIKISDILRESIICLLYTSDAADE